MTDNRYGLIPPRVTGFVEVDTCSNCLYVIDVTPQDSNTDYFCNYECIKIKKFFHLLETDREFVKAHYVSHFNRCNEHLNGARQ